jgi:superfamily I DNA and RNA helicase
MDLVIGTNSNPAAVDRLVAELKSLTLTHATLYVGYPILATADQSYALDAILTCVEHGIVIFDLDTPQVLPNWQAMEDRQGELEIGLKSKLLRHKSLTERRDLAIPIHIVTYLPHPPSSAASSDLLRIVVEGDLRSALLDLKGMDEAFVRPLNAAIQQVATIKPQNKRLSVKNGDSRGGKLKIIEREIANLDRWQKRGAIECPEGPQRIRGLAGSGKTVVLALKAAYLHAQHPDWDIAVGFQTRSLYGQFRDLIRRFTFEHIGDEPNWNKLKVLHAWGGSGTGDPGIYSLIVKENNLPFHDFSYGKRNYLAAGAFEGVCKEALESLKTQQPVSLFDALLLDEAQDFGAHFFRLAYSSVRDPRRFIWAYDELQSLKETSVPGLAKLFGEDAEGEPLVKFRSEDGHPQQDVILPICYRNTEWALSMAHALGFGVYRLDGLIQMFDEPSLWGDIGYRLLNGSLSPGATATLARRSDATPEFFQRLLTAADAVQCHTFDNDGDQTTWVADQIKTNLDQDELEPGDILVIFANPLSATSDAGPLIAKLRKHNIDAHIAGVTTGPNDFFKKDSVVISGIYRAKGNEAPMVYVLGGEYCHEGIGLIRRRNILFTAITRSRGWVRLCGVGDAMKGLQAEWNQVVKNRFQLTFTVPTPDELEKMRKIHRDRTEDEVQKIEKSRRSLEEILELIEREELALEDLSPATRRKLAKLLGGA